MNRQFGKWRSLERIDRGERNHRPQTLPAFPAVVPAALIRYTYPQIAKYGLIRCDYYRLLCARDVAVMDNSGRLR
jgi:hypothetical protein